MTSDLAFVRIDQIAQINPRRTVKKGSDISFVDMAAISENQRHIDVANISKRLAKAAGSHFSNGDTLLARITPCLENGKTAQVYCLEAEEVAEGSTEFIVLCGIDRQDNDFVYYLCRDPIFREYAIGRMEGTSGRQRVSWQSIAGYKFLAPPKNERKEIAETLSSLDNRIRLLHESNKTLEAIAQAIFKSWFIDFDPVRAKLEGRVPAGIGDETAALFPDELVESEIGLVPKGWDVKTIGDVVATVGGATPDTKNIDYWEPAKHHWTSPKDLSGINDPVLLSTERRISSTGLSKIGSGLLPSGTLLMSSRAPIGYLAITDVPVAINQGYIAMPPGGQVSPLYMLRWCQANMEGIKGRANGSTFMEISKKAFRPIPILLPNRKLLDLFEETCGTLFNKLVLNSKEAQTLCEIRDLLLPRLISGRLRLVDEKAGGAI